MQQSFATTPLHFTKSVRTTHWRQGIIIADTKFEFGLDENGNIVLGDEMLTPDSSRFWPAQGYEAGHSPAVLRQAVRTRLAHSPSGQRLDTPAGRLFGQDHR